MPAICYFEKGLRQPSRKLTLYPAMDDLWLQILLLLPPECWYCKCEPSCHTQHKYWKLFLSPFNCLHCVIKICSLCHMGDPTPTFQNLWFYPSLSIWNAFVCLCAHSSVHQRKKDTITSVFGFKNIKNFDHDFLWPIGKYLQIIILKKPGMELIHEMPSLGSWVKKVISSKSQ